MNPTLKQGILIATLFTVITPLIVLNSTKPGDGQEQSKSLASLVVSQTPNSSGAGNLQQRSNSQAPLVAEIAYQYAATQRSPSALKILDQALNLAETTLSDCYKSTPLMQVANGYILAGEAAKGQKLLTRAFQIAREQTITNCRLSATSPEESLLNRATEYAEAGDYNFALSIIDGVDNWARPMAMAKIAGSYLQDKQPEQARQLIKRAIDIAQRTPDSQMRRQMLTAIGFTLQESKHLGLLPPVIKQIQATFNSQDKAPLENDSSMKVLKTLSLAKMLVATDEKAQAIALLNQVLPEIQAIPLQSVLISPSARRSKIIYLTQFATQYAAAGQPEQAKTLLFKARTVADSFKSLREREQKLEIVARAYTEIGQVQMAEDLARRMTSVDARDSVLGAIALHYVKTGNIPQATTIARSLTTAKNLTLRNIVIHLLQIKQYEQALEIAKQEKIESMEMIVAALAEAGKPARALQITESLRAEELSREFVCLDCVMSTIAKSFAKQGQLEQALQVAQRIQTKDEKSQVLTMIAAQYVKTDRVANQNKATEILDQAMKIALSISLS